MEVALNGSAYLTALTADVARLLALLPPVARINTPVDSLAKAALVLEGVAESTVPSLDAATARLADAPAGDVAHADPRAGSWQDTLQMDDADPQLVSLLRAREVCGIAAAANLTGTTSDVVAETTLLHAALTDQLVAASRRGAVRTFDVAVHDSGSGRILYQPIAPPAIPASLDRLAAYMATAQAAGTPVVHVAAVVLYALQVIQPFDAANGRVALLSARRVLQGAWDGYAPDVETVLARDRGGFHAEIAQTLRRGDVTFFAERYVEAVAEALRLVARDNGLLDAAPSVPAGVLATLRQNRSVTVNDVKQADVTALWDAGLVSPVAGMHGLKFLSHLAD